MDHKCWKCGAEGFIIHNGVQLCRKCFQAITCKSNNDVRVIAILLACARRRLPTRRFLWACSTQGLLTEAIRELSVLGNS